MFADNRLEPVDHVPAGNIVGIGGLGNIIVKTATLSSSKYCVPFNELPLIAMPIYRVAIEPVNPQDMPLLVQGLKMLNQADASVEVSIETNGELVISTLGEVHVEKCVYDLENEYAHIKVNVSKPIVSFRETIVPDATIDMVNEVITKKSDKENKDKIATVQTANKLCTIKVLALPMSSNVLQLIEKYSDIFKMLANLSSKTNSYSTTCLQLIQKIRLQLTKAFDELKCKDIIDMTSADLIQRIWCFGSRKHCTNILFNLTDYEQPNIWSILDNEPIAEKSNSDIRHNCNSAFINGFDLVTSSGPLCEEPMHGVCFFVLEWDVNLKEDISDSADTSSGMFSGKAFSFFIYLSFSISLFISLNFTGQVVTAFKQACRQAFQNQPQRLVTPMYSCNIEVNADVLGKYIYFF